MLYSFIRRLTLPFTEWEMFKVGLINSDGEFLIPKDRRTPEQKSSYSYYDLLILNLKRMLAKVPGGSTRLATFAAALFLLREKKPISESATIRLTEQFSQTFGQYLDEAKMLVENEGAPTNNVGGGGIADNRNGGPNATKLIRRKAGKPNANTQSVSR